jgi:hypothetical protein
MSNLADIGKWPDLSFATGLAPTNAGPIDEQQEMPAISGADRQPAVAPSAVAPHHDPFPAWHAQTAMIENGFVHLPKEAAWLPEYLHELTAFPKGKHDDQVDSTAQMLDWFKQAGSGPSSNAGIWHLYKAQHEAQQAGAQTAQLPRRYRPCFRVSAGDDAVANATAWSRNIDLLEVCCAMSARELSRCEAQRSYRHLPWPGEARQGAQSLRPQPAASSSDFTTQDLVSSPFLIAPLLADGLSSAFGRLGTIAEADGCRAARSDGWLTPLRSKRQQCSCCFY